MLVDTLVVLGVLAVVVSLWVVRPVRWFRRARQERPPLPDVW